MSSVAKHVYHAEKCARDIAAEAMLGSTVDRTGIRDAVRWARMVLRLQEPTVEYMGYEVEWTDNDAAPCILRGTRGATYGAMRCRGEGSEWCYLINLRGRIAGNVARIKGNGWLRIPRGSQEIGGAQ